VRLDASGADHGAPLTDPSLSPPTQAVESTDGVLLTVHDLGGPGPDPIGARRRPILLTHATGFHGLVWAPVARHLAGFHAWAPDLRGHGASPTPTDRGMDWDGFADDVLAVVDALRERSLVEGELVAAGHSKGGAALLLAEQRRPGTFAALYCYEPVVFPPDLASADGARAPEGPNPLAAGARRRRPTFDSRDQAFDHYASKPLFSVVDPEALRAYVDHGFVDRPGGGVELACRPEIEAQVFEMASTHQAFAHLGEVTCPVTIATGAGGDFGPADFAEQIADALPNGRLARYPDLGHFGPLEAPARIAAGIAEAVTPPA
jgi:pimeloyl-ACP methyl ester carboxylesterase